MKGNIALSLGTLALWSTVVFLASTPVISTIQPGSEPLARRYYAVDLAPALGFKDATTIFDSTLDDVARYLGYAGLTGPDMQGLSPEVLMSRDALGQPCSSPPGPNESACAAVVSNPAELARTFSTRPLRTGDILAARFFAPKIINVSEDEATRELGWRKLVRLRSRPGSIAAAHHIAAGIILFNFFSAPGQAPFQADAESVNTQVMLLSSSPQQNAIYWLDYGALSKGGKLSMALNASFDAADFQAFDAKNTTGKADYFVPDGCEACHGAKSLSQ